MCVEIDLDKPLVASYKMRGMEGQLQYEGPHDLCFTSGKYGHKEIKCLLTTAKTNDNNDEGGRDAANMETNREATRGEKSMFGPWMVAQRAHRRPTMGQRVFLEYRNIKGRDFRPKIGPNPQ